MFKTFIQPIEEGFLQVAEWEGEKDAIVAIHGLTGNFNHMRALAEEFSPEYRFIAYDLRGRGRSSLAGKNSSVLKHAEDAVQLLERLNCKSAILIGHSLGAYISAIVASQYHQKIKALVLLDGGGVIGDEVAEKIKPALSRMEKTFTSKLNYVEELKQIYAAMGLQWNEYVEASVHYEIEENSDGVFKFRGEPQAILSDLQSCFVHHYDHDKIFANIKCPVLLVVAAGKIGDAPLYTEETFLKIRELLPNINYHVDESNHYTMVLDKQPKLYSVIREFLNRI